MISKDQDAVTQRAREATPEDLAAEAAGEAEKGELKRLNDENEDRLSRLDTLTPAELMLTRAPHYAYKEKDWTKKFEVAQRVEKAKERLNDEIAYARVLARRGALPDKAWPHDWFENRDPQKPQSDPRRAEWRDEVWRIACAASQQIHKLDFEDKRPADAVAFAESIASGVQAFVNAVNLLKVEAQSKL